MEQHALEEAMKKLRPETFDFPGFVPPYFASPPAAQDRRIISDEKRLGDC